MSRWNALKSHEPKAISNFKSRQPTRENEDRSLKTWKQGRKVRSYDEILVTLRAAKHSWQLEKAFFYLADLDLDLLRRIPAEKAAVDLVDTFMLPNLVSPTVSETLSRSILDVVDKLVRVPSLCSAMFSPLTVDVAPLTGSEQQIPNPVGRKLLVALQMQLPQSCSTLITVVDEIRKRSIADTMMPIDPRRLEPFFAEHLLVATMQDQSLELLRLVLLTFPNSYMTLKSLFLTDFRIQRREFQCETCLFVQGSSLLLTLLHNCTAPKLVSSCIACFLQLFPLDAWLNSKTVGSMKLFGENVRSDLIQLVRILRCSFSISEHSSKLIEIVLMTIPYVNNPDDTLTREAIHLVSDMASVVMDDMSNIHALDCLCECMGGRPLPSGGNTLISTPVSLWLLDSQLFQEYIFECLDKLACPSRSFAIKLLSAIVRTQPGFADWDRFHPIVQRLIATTQHRTEGMLLLESFVIGRNQCASSISTRDNSEISMVLLQAFSNVTLDDLRPVRLSCLQGYCVFSEFDWHVAIKSSLIVVCMDQITRFCTQGTSIEKPIAFRAMGELMYKCSSSDKVDDDDVAQFCSCVLPTIRDGLSESKEPAVRAMANFAVGNLALGVRERNSNRTLIAPLGLLDLLESCVACIDAPSDKVSGNAIRTVGHVANLAFHEPYVSQLISTEAEDGFQTVVNKLLGKLHPARNTPYYNGMTWKQRSVANKHAWGSCNALGLILDCDVAIQNLKESREVCEALIACMKQHTVLSEKIVLAAIGALNLLDSWRLQELSHGAGLIGMVVSTCLTSIPQAVINSKIHKQLNQLLLHTIPIISVLDAHGIVHAEGVTSSHLDWLYDWMIANNMNAAPYEKFAIVFDQESAWDSSVGLEQRFASRAALAYREDGVLDAGDEDEI